MNPHYPNPLTQYGSIKITPPVFQPNKLSASQQQQLHQQKKKQQFLKQQTRQLQLNLLNLKQSSKNFHKLISTIKSQPNYSHRQQTILEKAESIADLLQKSTDISERLLNIKQQKLDIYNQMMKIKVDELNYIMFVHTQEGRIKQADSMIKLYEKRIQDVAKEVEEVERSIDSFEKASNLTDQINEFNRELNNLYPNQISQTEFILLQNIDFSTLASDLLNEIKSHKTSISQLSTILLNLRQQASILIEKTRSRDEVQFKLKQNKQTCEKNRSQHEELKKHNDYLEEFMDFEVEKEVREKGNEVNELHFKQTKKYLMASEFLLNGFAQLVKDQFLEFLGKLNNLKQQADQKKQFNFIR